MTGDIRKFIRARLNEDATEIEQAITDAEQAPPLLVHASDGTTALIPHTGRVVWWQRRARGVAAKRRILAWHTDDHNLIASSHPTIGCRCYGGWPCPTLRLMASEWSDHKDYQEGWKP